MRRLWRNKILLNLLRLQVVIIYYSMTRQKNWSEDPGHVVKIWQDADSPLKITAILFALRNNPSLSSQATGLKRN